MNRDALLATIIGFGVGLLIMGILLISPNIAGFFPHISWPAFLTRQQAQKSGVQTPSKTALSIDSPLPDAIESENTVLVSGKAVAGSVVVIQGPLDDIVVTATPQNTYAGKIRLTEGANDIVVGMYDHGEQTSQTLTIYYTPEEF